MHQKRKCQNLSKRKIVRGCNAQTQHEPLGFQDSRPVGKAEHTSWWLKGKEVAQPKCLLQDTSQQQEKGGASWLNAEMWLNLVSSSLQLQNCTALTGPTESQLLKAQLSLSEIDSDNPRWSQ